MPLDIVIRSYWRDEAWLRLSIRSILRFVRGYREIVVVLPRASLGRMDLDALRSSPPVRVTVCPDHPDDYLGQQLTKLHADEVSDAEVIVHLDSDQVFVADCDLREALLDGGRCRVALDSAGRRPAADPWRRCPAAFFGRDFPWDLCTAPPLALPQGVHAGLRAECLTRHGITIDEYARRATAARFSEQALLRAYALVHAPRDFSWTDVRGADLVPQCWTFFSRARTPASIAGLLPPELR
jgi:hypothetical protein